MTDYIREQSDMDRADDFVGNLELLLRDTVYLYKRAPTDEDEQVLDHVRGEIAVLLGKWKRRRAA